MNRISLLFDALVFARGYTVSLLDTIPVADWFAMPAGCPTHVAWQIGHLAMAEARLVVERIGGRRVVEEGVLPAEYLRLFGRESVPDPNPANQPSPAELRATFDRVHEVTLQTLRDTVDVDLETVVIGSPHRFCRTKLDFARWVGAHEMMHAGQIGLLRRMLGQKPAW
jgi:DinB superfamily